MASMTTLSCLHCGISFTRLTKEVARSGTKFCSISCSSRHRVPVKKERVVVQCATCGADIKKLASRVAKSKTGLFFCDRTCADKGHQVETGLLPMLLPHYRDGGTYYRQKALKALPRLCAICGWKEVPEVLTVHHIDRDRSNNDLCNLQILCPTCHEIEHWRTHSGKYTKMVVAASVDQ